MSVAKAYAKALFEAVSEGKSPAEASSTSDQIQAQLAQFQDIVKGSKEAQIALFGPITTSKEKVALVQQFSKLLNAAPMVERFLILLANKDRLSLLAQMAEAFAEVRLEAEGGLRGKLTSAEPLSDSEVQELAATFSKKFGKKVAFQVTTDPALLAGVKVTLSGVTYDGTVRAQLQQLKDRFVAGLAE